MCISDSLYNGPFPLPADVVLRARAFRPDQLPSKELCLTLINGSVPQAGITAVSYTHHRAHETVLDLVCRLLLEKKNSNAINQTHTKASPIPLLFTY